jgi:hypothetical protein
MSRSRFASASTRVLALASVAIAMAGAPALAIVVRPSDGVTMPATDALRHPIASECHVTKVCARWATPHHTCLRWTVKKVCGPPLNATEKPPGTPQRVKKRL